MDLAVTLFVPFEECSLAQDSTREVFHAYEVLFSLISVLSLVRFQFAADNSNQFVLEAERPCPLRYVTVFNLSSSNHSGKESFTPVTSLTKRAKKRMR